MVPKDPSSDSATAYLPGQMGYAYLSTDAATWGTCSKNQYYLLVTHLENPNDSDRLELKPVTICGTDITTATYGNNAFVIAQ